jgi:hypothetical protein
MEEYLNEVDDSNIVKSLLNNTPEKQLWYYT